MEDNLGSFKSLEQVYLKATQNIEFNEKNFEEGEIIACFDKIQVAGLNELKRYVFAHGGYDDRGLVYWETTKQLNLTFSQGVFSTKQFSLLNNTKVIEYGEDEPILITKVEQLESDQGGHLTTTYIPSEQIFVYDKETGEKLDWILLGGEQLYLGREHGFQEVIVSYKYNYHNGAAVAKIGQRCLKGFLELEGRTRVKDDTSGLITTGIIKIPKLKLMSGLSMRLGVQANPVVGTFEAVGIPVEQRHNSYVAEFLFLNNDIDSDM